MVEPAIHRSHCPLASALDIVGDRWSLIVLRDLFVGAGRYGDFLKGPETISTNILADRLRVLECAGLIERLAGKRPGKRHRYRLTRNGADLLPVLQSLAQWGYAHLPDRWRPPDRFMTAKPADFYPDSDRS